MIWQQLFLWHKLSLYVLTVLPDVSQAVSHKLTRHALTINPDVKLLIWTQEWTQYFELHLLTGFGFKQASQQAGTPYPRDWEAM